MSSLKQRLRGGTLTRPARRRALNRWLCVTLFAAAVVSLKFVAVEPPPAQAQQQQQQGQGQGQGQQQQWIPCPPEQQPLLQIPELASVNNVLRGTIMLSDERQTIPFRYPANTKPGDPLTTLRCQGQYVRTLRGVGATPAAPAAPGQQYPNPMPGPTLRARVGDIINLTFLNQINPGHFPRSIDNGEMGKCDQPIPPGDVFPDCFHGSSTGNIHFHGSHVNPNNTGDNVFVEVRPLPRDNQGRLTTTPEQVQVDLDDFYKQCTERLQVSPLVIWPRTWADLPPAWTKLQKSLLNKDYPEWVKERFGAPPVKQIGKINEAQISQNAWPQYYVGAFPYCFRLPEYKQSVWPPAPQPAAHAGHPVAQGTREGAGTAELNTKNVIAPEQLGTSPNLIMGQSPGTHWYHAHKHGSTAINVANGMTGAFIIEGPYDDALNAYYGDGWTRTQPLMIINQLGVTPNLLRGGQGGQDGRGATDKGPNLSVNGQMNPVINMMPGEVQMWRIVNTSGRAGAYIVPQKDQLEWRQIAQDGVQFNYFNYDRLKGLPFVLASGNRGDFLVQAKPCPQGQKTCSYPVQAQIEVDPSDLGRANKVTIMTVNVIDQTLPAGSPRLTFITQAKYPQQPPFLADISDEEVKHRRSVLFASTPPNNFPAQAGQGQPMAGQHTIDGKKFSNEVGELVKLNSVEEWTVQNASYGPAISHPFHIHVNPFQVTEIFDPNEPLINPATNQPYIDPKTKQPVVDPTTNQTATKYVFWNNNPPLPGQCYLNPDDPQTWRPMTWVPKKPATRARAGQPAQPAQPAHCVPKEAQPNKNNIWWDVFPIPSGYAPSVSSNNGNTQTPILNKAGKPIQVPGYFKMRSRFVDYAGFYVLHCHILAHEDRGMMTIVQVSAAPMPYSHH